MSSPPSLFAGAVAVACSMLSDFPRTVDGIMNKRGVSDGQAARKSGWLVQNLKKELRGIISSSD